MKFTLSKVLVLFVYFTSFAQECNFDYYAKKGGHYLFSTYFESDQQTRRDGTCERKVGSQIYAKRIFDNGHILIEELNHYNDGEFTPQIRTQLKHTTAKGQVIGFCKEYNEKGTLIRHFEFYNDKTGRRCERETEYLPTGKLRFIHEYAFVRLSEIDSFNLSEHPPHTIDDFGYTSLIVPYGKHRWYNDQGQLIREESYDQMTFYRQDSEHLLHGKFTEFHDNGNLRTEGQFKEGNPDGMWKRYHYYGALYEQGNYRNNIKDSLWQQWDDKGKLVKESFYDQKADNPFSAVREKEYNAAGLLVSSKEINEDKQAILQEWSTQGQLIRYVRYSNGIQMNWSNTDYREFEKIWYDNGQVKSIHNKRSDTSYVSYFRNGQMERLNIGLWNGTIRWDQNNEWNIQGTRIQQTETSYGNGKNLQTFKCFHTNGNLKQEIVTENNEQLNSRYSSQGECYLKSRTLNQQLEGEYMERDTLTGNYLIAHYQNGIRHGTYIMKNEGNILFQNLSYERGCARGSHYNFWEFKSDSTHETWKRRANYLIYHQGTAPWKSMEACVAYRDSLATWLAIFNHSADLDQLNFEEMTCNSLQVQLPQVYYRNLLNEGPKEVKTMALLNLIDSLGWTWKNVKLENGTYVGLLKFNGIINPAFQTKLLREHSSFFYPDFGAMDDSHDFLPRSWETPHANITVLESHPCYAKVQYADYGHCAQFIVYADGDVEFMNRTTNWSEWKKVLEDPSIIKFDHNFYWRD